MSSTDSIGALLSLATFAGALMGLLCSSLALLLGRAFQSENLSSADKPSAFAPIQFLAAHQHAVAMVTGAVALTALALALDPSLQLLLASVFALSLLTLALIDARLYVLPDQITLPLMWLGLLVNTQEHFAPVAAAVLGAIIGYLSLWTIYWLFKLLRNKEGMGYGDFKLSAAIGAWLGWQALPSVVLVAALAALSTAAALLLAGRFRIEQPMPFGPFLALAGFLAMCLDQPSTQWMNRVLI
ncbi:MAG: A24 family peptidase [Pseudomonadota bacterium]|nr:A24 family peptidase [Pseudomonadota bacterium]